MGDAADRVRALVDKRMQSWRSLNMQVRWTIIDEILEETKSYYSLHKVLNLMDDDTPVFWQRYLQRSDADRVTLIRDAIGRLSKKEEPRVPD